MSDVKFPKIKVKLTGSDGNAFAIMGKVRNALKKGGATPAEVKAYLDESMSGDYNHLLATAMKWVDVS